MYGTLIMQSKKWLPVIVILLITWVIYPVSLAILFAYFFQPIVKWIHQKTRLPRWLTVFLFEGILILTIITIATLVIKELFEIVYPLRFHLEELKVLVNDNKANWKSALETFSILSETIIKKVSLFVQHLPEQLVETFVFLIAFYFALLESIKSRTWFFIYIPSAARKVIKPLFVSATQLFAKFTKVEVVLFLTTFIQLGIGFYILNFSSPIGLAFLISFADVMPFLGTGIFLIPMAVFFMVTNHSTLGMIILLLYAFILLTRQLLESYLWANTMHIRAIHVFFISACSLLMFGVPGILLSPFLLLAAVHFREHPWFTSQ